VSVSFAGKTLLLKLVIIFLNIINRLTFVTEKQCVLDVSDEYFNFVTTSCFKGL